MEILSLEEKIREAIKDNARLMNQYMNVELSPEEEDRVDKYFAIDEVLNRLLEGEHKAAADRIQELKDTIERKEEAEYDRFWLEKENS
jgi:hypothetical protein